MPFAAIDDQIVARTPEAHRKVSQICAAVTELRMISQPVEGFDHRVHDPIGCVRISPGDVVEDESEIVFGRRLDTVASHAFTRRH